MFLSIRHILLLSVFLFSFINAQEKKESELNPLSGSMISVTIGGSFPITGSFPASAAERVDQFLTRIYLQVQSATQNKELDKIESALMKEKNIDVAWRDILLKRANGEVLKLDLIRFRNNADFKNNPYLKNDDVIIFPPIDLEKNCYYVYGAVNEPGVFQFVEGDRLNDAIEFGKGINKAYENVTDAEIYRLSYDGSTQTVLKVKISDNPLLMRGDRIRIGTDETERKDFSITLLGEVRNSGYVPITKGTTTLADVIKMSGGLTKDANLKNVKLFSSSSFSPFYLEKLYGITAEKNPEEFTELQIKLLDQMSTLENHSFLRLSNMTEQDTAYFLLENRLRWYLDHQSIDATDYDKPNSLASTFILHDGDVVYIPKKDKHVTVLGYVNKPGRIPFSEGKDYKYYIDQCEGSGEFVIEDEIMVIKGSTKQWLSPIEQNVTIEAGDFVYVPRSPARSFWYYFYVTSNYLTLLGSVATIILLFISLGK